MPLAEASRLRGACAINAFLQQCHMCSLRDKHAFPDREASSWPYLATLKAQKDCGSLPRSSMSSQAI